MYKKLIKERVKYESRFKGKKFLIFIIKNFTKTDRITWFSNLES